MWLEEKRMTSSDVPMYRGGTRVPGITLWRIDCAEGGLIDLFLENIKPIDAVEMIGPYTLGVSISLFY